MQDKKKKKTLLFIVVQKDININMHKKKKSEINK